MTLEPEHHTLPLASSVETGESSAIPRVDIKSLGRKGLESWLEAAGEPAYRAAQILQWVYSEKGYAAAKSGDAAAFFTSLSNLSKALREKLAASFKLSHLEPTNLTGSEELEPTQTVKFLFKLHDGYEIETVLIPNQNGEHERLTVCVSSQVGCALGCKFCATGYMGFTRNLTTGEILDQVGYAVLWAKEHWQKRVSHVVFMGMGEPMLNYERVIEASVMLSDFKYLFQIGQRHITISTSGVATGIRRFADDPAAKFNLAVSLHSANPEKRADFMPITNEFSLEALRESIGYYFHKKGRPVFYEYLLLSGVNDTEADARALIKFCRISDCKINLIDFNPIPEAHFERSNSESKETFRQMLYDAGFTVTVRRSRGKDIGAACGQLATSSRNGKQIKRNRKSNQKSNATLF
ncbi:MAG: 23S rRNA (adenine(2503)-C(2))-methyltransferase RlmN [Chloroherpetonaceae bacterium]|nr:23S rRNA (adenine(2503)-C(2))-methyltransferase RlmN [Chloroherpetonaceae bacterium]